MSQDAQFCVYTLAESKLLPQHSKLKNTNF